MLHGHSMFSSSPSLELISVSVFLDFFPLELLLLAFLFLGWILGSCVESVLGLVCLVWCRVDLLRHGGPSVVEHGGSSVVEHVASFGVSPNLPLRVRL